MSQSTQQFVEMIRQAHARIEKRIQPRPMYCMTCGKQTQHTAAVSGAWEIYTCGTCQAQQQYIVG